MKVAIFAIVLTALLTLASGKTVFEYACVNVCGNVTKCEENAKYCHVHDFESVNEKFSDSYQPCLDENPKFKEYHEKYIEGAYPDPVEILDKSAHLVYSVFKHENKTAANEIVHCLKKKVGMDSYLDVINEDMPEQLIKDANFCQVHELEYDHMGTLRTHLCVIKRCALYGPYD